MAFKNLSFILRLLFVRFSAFNFCLTLGPFRTLEKSRGIKNGLNKHFPFQGFNRFVQLQDQSTMNFKIISLFINHILCCGLSLTLPGENDIWLKFRLVSEKSKLHPFPPPTLSNQRIVRLLRPSAHTFLALFVVVVFSSIFCKVCLSVGGSLDESFCL